MSAEEKVQTMEAIWQSLSANPDAIESPDWHEEGLRVREAQATSGEAKFVDWERPRLRFVAKLREDRNLFGGAFAV
jgi:hypothetical protein